MYILVNLAGYLRRMLIFVGAHLPDFERAYSAYSDYGVLENPSSRLTSWQQKRPAGSRNVPSVRSLRTLRPCLASVSVSVFQNTVQIKIGYDGGGKHFV